MKPNWEAIVEDLLDGAATDAETRVVLTVARFGGQIDGSIRMLADAAQMSNSSAQRGLKRARANGRLLTMRIQSQAEAGANKEPATRFEIPAKYVSEESGLLYPEQIQGPITDGSYLPLSDPVSRLSTGSSFPERSALKASEGSSNGKDLIEGFVSDAPCTEFGYSPVVKFGTGSDGVAYKTNAHAGACDSPNTPKKKSKTGEEEKKYASSTELCVDDGESPAVSTWFDQFWLVYPRGTPDRKRGAKQFARLAFSRIPPMLWPEVVAAAALYGERQQPAFIRRPDRFLLDGFWQTVEEMRPNAARGAPPGSAQLESERNAERRRALDAEIERIRNGDAERPRQLEPAPTGA